MSIVQDCAYAARGMWRRPGLSVAAIVTLGIGIAANTAVFGFAQAFILRPLPFTNPDRLVHIWHLDRSAHEISRAAWPNVLDWKERSRSCADIGVFNYSAETIVGDAGPVLVPIGRVSANVFDLLGARPVLGRGFVEGDDRPGRADVVVLSYGMWQSDYAGRQDVLGQTIALDRKPRTIVGVMGPDFQFPLNITRLWVPYELDPARYPRTLRSFQVVARLKDDVTIEEATGDLERVAAALEREWPDANRNATVRLVPLQQALNFAYDVLEPMLALLGAGVAFVLGLACANVAGLLLAAASARQREMAVRTALGASRGRLTLQVVTETLLLAVPGALLGLLLSVPVLRSIEAAVPPDIYRVGRVALDGATLFFTAAVAVAAGLLAGTAPALRLARTNFTSLRDGASLAPSRAGRLLQNGLVAGQIALALALVGGAALTWRSVVALGGVNPGFDSNGVFTGLVSLPRTQYGDRSRVLAFQDEVLSALAQRPHVRSAALVNMLPLNHETDMRRFRIAGQEAPAGSRRAVTLHASDRYFETLGIPLLRGRTFTPSDGAAADLRAVISATMAGRFWPDGDAIGRSFQLEISPEAYRDATVVGVVNDTAQDDLGRPSPWQVYISVRQANVRYFRVLTRGDGPGAAADVRAAIAAADPAVAVTELRTLSAVLDEYILPQRAVANVLVTLAGVALVLAVVGLHAMVAFFVAQHARDIGIRIALGAERRHVMRIVLGRTATLLAIGFVAGSAAIIAGGELLSTFLYGVSPADPRTFGALVALFGTSAAAAAARPLARGLRIDPAVSMREPL